MALLWIGAAGISVAVMQHELNEAYDDSLRQAALRLLPLAVHDLGEREHASPGFVLDDRSQGADSDDDDRLPGAAPGDATFTYFVRNASGQLVLRDKRAPEDIGAGPPLAGFGDMTGQRTFALADPRSGYSIVIVELSDRRMTSLRDSAAALALPLLALIPLIGGGVWLAMRLALRPLEALRRDIAQRDSRNLSPLRSEGHPAELAPIVDAVAALLERLKAALDAERAFAARSAHELRTPIAGALAQTQQLAEELDGKPGAQRVHEIETSLKRLSKLSEKMLQLARIEAGFARSDDETDQLPVLRMVVRDINANSAWKDRVTLDIEDLPALRGAIDADAFAIVIRNLIENGLKHGARGAMVRVVAEDGTLHVLSEGAAVDAEALSRLGQPFVRGDTPADGTGLGLSIARSILEQAGGRLTLASPIGGQDGGFEAIVTLPRGAAQTR